MDWVKVDVTMGLKEIEGAGHRVQDTIPKVLTDSVEGSVDFVFEFPIDPDGDGLRDRFVKVTDHLYNYPKFKPHGDYERGFVVKICNGVDRCGEAIVDEYADGNDVRINEVGYMVYVGAFLDGDAEQIALVDRSGAVTIYAYR